MNSKDEGDVEFQAVLSGTPNGHNRTHSHVGASGGVGGSEPAGLMPRARFEHTIRRPNPWLLGGFLALVHERPNTHPSGRVPRPSPCFGCSRLVWKFYPWGCPTTFVGDRFPSMPNVSWLSEYENANNSHEPYPASTRLAQRC